jgi:hypothetical protein
MAGMMTDPAIKNGARRSWMRTVGAPAIVSAVLAAALLAPACGDGASSNGPRDAGLDATDSAAVVVEAPDLRFKWVGAGLAMHFVGFTNLGTALAGTYTEHGPLGVTPLELSGEVSSEYRVFSVANLEPMSFTATTNRLPGIDADLAQAVNSRAIVVGLDCSFQPGVPGGNPDGIYNALLSGSEGGVTYLPTARATTTAADFPAWVASEAAAGRVVTAFCPTNDGLYATAFGRTGDDTSYETQVVTATLDQLVAYVVTALGRGDSGVDGAATFVAVGTRPAGQTAARSLKTVDQPCVVGATIPGVPEQSFFDDGYALIGVIFHGTGSCNGETSWLFIGER